MSDARYETPTALANSKEIRARAAEWVLEKHASGNWSDESQAALDAWLAQSPAHLLAYWRLDETWDRTNRLAALKCPTAENAEPATNRGNRWSGTAAAIFAVVLLGAGVLTYLSAPREKTYATAVGGHQLVKLADGSRIELNTDTILRTQESAGERNVWLDRGEAYFQIRHDAARPFVVIAAGHRVTDLGTKFVVRRDTGRVEVAVVEGRVRLEAADAQTKPALLTSGDTATATANALSLAKKQAQNLNDELGWRHGVLVFHHTALADVAAEFNRYNGQKIVIADNSTARMTINGTFPTKDVAAFVRLSRAVLGLRIEDRGEETVISR